MKAQLNRKLAVILAACIAAAMGSAPAARAQDAPAVWQELAQPKFNPEKSATVNNVTIVRDRIRITLASGVIQFAHPVNGVICGADFRGKGRLQVESPNPIESGMVRLLTGRDHVDMEFTEATFSFVDGTFEEVARQVQFSGAPGSNISELYNSRMKAREDVGAAILPRLFKSLLSPNRQRTAFFLADVKTAEKGWVQATYDAMEPEEISVGRWTKPAKVQSRYVRFDTWLSVPAGNRTSQEAFRDPLALEDVLIRGYRAVTSVTEREELRATTSVMLDVKLPGERVLLFDLDANLRVESVSDGKGAAIPFFQPPDPGPRDQSYGDYVAVALPAPAAAGQSLTLEFSYAGKRLITKMGEGIFFCQSYGWYPTRARTAFVSRADFDLTFRSPAKYAFVATGNKVSESLDGPVLVTQWKSDVPLAVAGFAFGEYKFVSEKSGAVDVQVYANKNPDDMMRAIEWRALRVQPRIDSFGQGGYYEITKLPTGDLSAAGMAKTITAETGNTLRIFEKYFGPYPYKSLAVTSIPYFYGQGWPGLIYLSGLSFLDSTQRDVLQLKQNHELSDAFRGHEVSHQWWGHRVGWKSYHDQWLSEGFAEFSGNLYVHMRQSMKDYLSRLREDRRFLSLKDENGRVYESVGPLWMGARLSNSESVAAYSLVVYRKGGLVLHMLRMMLYDPGNPQNPEQRFMQMMQEFCRTYENKPASTEDFKAIAEKYMTPAMDIERNRRLDWFFRQYVYGTGIPQYEFRYSVQPAPDGKFKVTGTIRQSNVPDGWKDILPLYLHQGDKAMLMGWTRADQKESKLEFTLGFNPGKLSLNAYNDVLADVKQ